MQLKLFCLPPMAADRLITQRVSFLKSCPIACLQIAVKKNETKTPTGLSRPK